MAEAALGLAGALSARLLSRGTAIVSGVKSRLSSAATAALESISLVSSGMKRGFERRDEPVAGGERVDRRRGRDLTLREHVVVAHERVPGALSPVALNRRCAFASAPGWAGASWSGR